MNNFALRPSLCVKLIMAIVLVAIVFCAAETSDAKGPAAANVNPYTGEDMSWTSAPWDKDDASYLAARNAVDSASSQPGFDSYIGQCRSQTEAEPRNVMAVFKFAYAIWLKGKLARSDGALFDLACNYQNDVCRDDLTRTYDGARIRFLFEAETSIVPNPRLIDVGERLLMHTGNDADVKVMLASLYLYQVQIGESHSVAKATELCQQARASEPESPLPYGLLSMCYGYKDGYCDGWDAWKSNPSARMSPKALCDFKIAYSYLEQEIKLTNPKDAWYTHLVQLLSVWQKIFSANGVKPADY